jgi:hypothetical protein
MLLSHVDHRPFITHRFPLERASDAYEMLASNPRDVLQVLLTYEEP